MRLSIFAFLLLFSSVLCARDDLEGRGDSDPREPLLLVSSGGAASDPLSSSSDLRGNDVPLSTAGHPVNRNHISKMCLGFGSACAGLGAFVATLEQLGSRSSNEVGLRIMTALISGMVGIVPTAISGAEVAMYGDSSLLYPAAGFALAAAGVGVSASTWAETRAPAAVAATALFGVGGLLQALQFVAGVASRRSHT